MHQLVGQAIKRAADLELHSLVQVRQLLQEPLQLAFLGTRVGLYQLRDDRLGRTEVDLHHESIGLCVDDPDSFGQFSLAFGRISLAHRLQVVHRVQEHVGETADRRLKVARHGQVQDQDGATRTSAVNLREVLHRHDGATGPCRADDQIRGREGGQQFVPGTHATGMPLGQCHGRWQRPVDDGDVGHAEIVQVRQRFLGHFARTDHQRDLVVEAFKHLPRKIGDRHAGNADAAFVDGRLGGHATSDLGRPLEHGMRNGSGGLLLGGSLVSALDLRGDLRFPDHHAVEAAGHQEQVANGVASVQIVKVLRHVPRIHLLFRCQGFRQLGAGRRIVALGGRVQLHTIAGREQDDFQLREALSEPMQRLANPLRPERETLANGDGCMVMAAPQ